MQAKPNALALIAEVARVLKTEFLPDAKPEQQYTLRMMINALSIAQRQVEAMPHSDEQAWMQLSVLLDAEDDLKGLERLLANKARAGDLDDEGVLRVLLWRLTLQKVAESSPRYLQQEDID